VGAAVTANTAISAQLGVRIDEVSAGSQEQAAGIEQISKANTQMHQVTQSTAANAEESASASEELSAQAETMYAIVERLQSVVGTGYGQPDDRRHSRRQTPTQRSGPGRDLSALSSGVSRKTASAAQPAFVRSGRIDRSALPLDDDFKEF
jgi:methyl-accepting chemotaxis protein